LVNLLLAGAHGLPILSSNSMPKSIAILACAWPILVYPSTIEFQVAPKKLPSSFLLIKF